MEGIFFEALIFQQLSLISNPYRPSILLSEPKSAIRNNISAIDSPAVA
jgi:hypothetical protein